MIYIYPNILKILSFHHTQTKISHEIRCHNVVCGVFIRWKQFPVLKLLRTLTMKGCSEFLNLSSCGWFCVWFLFSHHGVFHSLTQVFCFRIKPTCSYIILSCLFKISVFMCTNYKLISAKPLTAFQGNTSPRLSCELCLLSPFLKSMQELSYFSMSYRTLQLSNWKSGFSWEKTMNLTSLLCLLRSFLSQLCNFSVQECAHTIHNTYKVGSTVPCSCLTLGI